MLINMAMLMIPKMLQGSLPFQHTLDNKGRLHRLNMLQVAEDYHKRTNAKLSIFRGIIKGLIRPTSKPFD